MSVRGGGRFHIVSHMGTKTAVKVRIIGVLNIELQKRRLVVWRRWRTESGCHPRILLHISTRKIMARLTR